MVGKQNPRKWVATRHAVHLRDKQAVPLHSITLGMRFYLEPVTGSQPACDPAPVFAWQSACLSLCFALHHSTVSFVPASDIALTGLTQKW